MEDNQLILSYNDNVLVGSRKWNGTYTDVPAMGYDGSDETVGYCLDRDVPTFKWVRSNGEVVDTE